MYLTEIKIEKKNRKGKKETHYRQTPSQSMNKNY